MKCLLLLPMLLSGTLMAQQPTEATTKAIPCQQSLSTGANKTTATKLETAQSLQHESANEGEFQVALQLVCTAIQQHCQGVHQPEELSEGADEKVATPVVKGLAVPYVSPKD